MKRAHFHLFGIPVRIHFSLWVVLGFLTFLNMQRGMEGVYLLYHFLFLIGIFGSVLLHEYGHAWTASLFGIKTRSITLSPLGGVAALESMPQDPWKEFSVAIAGPLVNGLIALLAGVTLALGFGWTELLGPLEMSFVESLLWQLLLANLSLGIFNLVPAFPMDGGRIFRALLTLRWPRVQSTQIAVSLAKVLAFSMGFWGVLHGNFMLPLIGVFVWSSANAENRLVRFEEMQKSQRGNPFGGIWERWMKEGQNSQSPFEQGRNNVDPNAFWDFEVRK